MNIGLKSRCAIMQPTYMPWAGYFHLISQTGVFVFLDDVQYEKGSWQNHNRVLIDGKSHWLTVPCRRLRLSQTIQTVQIDDRSPWRKKHMKLLGQSYAKHPYVREVLEVAEQVLDTSVTLLADLNIRIIRRMAEALELSPRFVRSSELAILGQRSERLVKICEHFGCEEYLSPMGAAEYLAQDEKFNNTRVRLLFQEYAPGPYPQLGRKEFESHLSILDVLANLGWEKTKQYIRTGSSCPQEVQ